MAPSQVRFQWMPAPVPQRFRTGVSLHSHTHYSRESFDFIRRAGLRTPVVGSLIRAAETRYQRRHGKCLELGRAWWTPPLGPGDVQRGELDQLRRLDLEGLVAITDHDDMQAPLDLRREHPAAPLSLEWSVPFGAALLHLGIYNLPAAQAGDIFLAMQRYRDAPEIHTLPEILAAAGSDPGALVVLNHPLYDETGIGEARHEEAMRIFLQMFGRYIHGIELNGLRPAAENERVRTLAASAGKTPISGGDRHGLETNAVINLTNAASFGEFAEEIRAGWSHLLFLDHYRWPHGLRVARETLDMLRNHNGHPRGWRAWTDRVFYSDEGGQVKSLREIWWPERIPAWRTQGGASATPGLFGSDCRLCPISGSSSQPLPAVAARNVSPKAAYSADRGAFSPACEGGVMQLHVTGTLIPALTGGANQKPPQPSGQLTKLS